MRPYSGIVVGLVWSNNPEGYSGGTVATGRVSHSGNVKGDDPNKKGYPGPPGWEFGVMLTTSPTQKTSLFEKPNDGRRMENNGRRPGKKYLECTL
jgi:hypothetical protein